MFCRVLTLLVLSISEGQGAIMGTFKKGNKYLK